MPHKDEQKRKQYARDWYKRNKEKVSQQSREAYANLSIEEKGKVIKDWNNWSLAHPEYRLWNQAKHSAKQRGLEFSIQKEDIFIPRVCPYLGVELTDIREGGRLDTNISLDRIDNTKGYVHGNIQVISSKANYMKRNATIPELISFAKGILNTHL